MTKTQEAPPDVTCMKCRRKEPCVPASDEAFCRPAAWLFPSEAHKMFGFCEDCRENADVKAMLLAAEGNTPGSS